MRSQIRYSSKIFSRNSGVDDILNIGSRWQNSNGNWNVPYLNRNDAERDLRLRWVDDGWGGFYRFAAVRNWLCFTPHFCGVLL
ncbi:MAG: hypothetical protein HY093_02680 [Candidatus Liptonbacteria bacterium]|nr:hypothetical protein [Candidatus Liptonbacteria bacterium]